MKKTRWTPEQRAANRRFEAAMAREVTRLNKLSKAARKAGCTCHNDPFTCSLAEHALKARQRAVEISVSQGGG